MAATPGAARLTLVWTPTFVRTARKFLRRHPALAGVFEDVLKQLESDPQAPRLRLHPRVAARRLAAAVRSAARAPEPTPRP